MPDNDAILDAAPHEFVRPQNLWQLVYTLPQNVLIAFLKVYRFAVSPLYGQVCRYYPSCSAYGLEAVTVHGALRGIYFTLMRLLRCHPWATGGIDPVPEGKRSFAPGEEPKIMLLNHPDRALTNVHPESTPRCAHHAPKEN